MQEEKRRHLRTGHSNFYELGYYYSDIKKDNILPFMTTWMDLEDAGLNEISQTEKGKPHIISCLSGKHTKHY